jgi:hypothetical protein
MEAARAAVAMAGTEYDGRALNVDFSQPKPEGASRPRTEAPTSSPSATGIIANR